MPLSGDAQRSPIRVHRVRFAGTGETARSHTRAGSWRVSDDFDDGKPTYQAISVGDPERRRQRVGGQERGDFGKVTYCADQLAQARQNNSKRRRPISGFATACSSSSRSSPTRRWLHRGPRDEAPSRRDWHDIPDLTCALRRQWIRGLSLEDETRQGGQRESVLDVTVGGLPVGAPLRAAWSR
jgi:hypothetical protein